MAQFEVASVDFDLAREYVKKLDTDVSTIVELVAKADKALDSAAETNTMKGFSTIAEGVKKISEIVPTLSDTVAVMTKTINDYESTYEADINKENEAEASFEGL